MRIFKNDYFWGLFWLSLLVLVFFLPLVLGWQTLFESVPTIFNNRYYQLPLLKTGWVWGGSNVIYIEAPQTMSALKIAKEGILPIWSPYAAGGYPLTAGLVGSLYFPIKTLIFFIAPHLATFDFYLILRFLIAGFGLFLYLKTIGLSRQSALLGSVAYMFSGYFVLNLTNWFLNVEMMLPYVLFAFEKYFQTQQKKYIGWSAFFLALLILGSNPQPTLINGLVIFTYFLFRGGIRRWRFFLLACFLAILIALPMIMDFSIFFNQSSTVHSGDPQIFKHYSLGQLFYFIVSPTMFLEFALGGHLLKDMPMILPYFAISIWLLALAGLVSKEKNRLQYFFLGVLIFLFFKYAGWPPVQWLSYLPIFNLVFWLEYYGAFFLALSVLAAFGLENLKNQRIQLKKLFYAVFCIPILYFLAFIFNRNIFINLYKPDFNFNGRRLENTQAFFDFFKKLPEILQKTLNYIFTHEITFIFILFGIVVFFTLLALISIYLIQKQKLSPAILIVVVVVELFAYMPKIRDGLFHRFDPYPKHPAIEFLQKQNQQKPWRFIATKDIIAPQTSAIFGLEDFRTNEAVVLKKYSQYTAQFMPLTDLKHLMSTSQKYQISNTFSFDEETYKADQHHRFLDLANIKYVVSDKELKDKNLELVFNGEGLIVYQNNTVLPRAYALINDKIFREEHFVNITRYQPNKIFIETNLPTAGQLVLSDAYYPGWKAYIDGQEIEIYPANIMFRGIKVPAGTHRVEFIYQPLWFWPSIYASLLGFILSILLIIYPLKKVKS